MTGRILIVDGLATNRLVLKGRLTPASYDIATAATLPEAMARLRAFAPDLVIVGEAVPDHDCAAICAMIRDDCGQDGAAIIALCPTDQRLAVMRAGASAVLEPRGDALLLLARIRGLLRNSASVDLPRAFAESQVPFQHGRTAGRLPHIVLVAETPSQALGWKHALSQRLRYRFSVQDAGQALASVARGEAGDLYLIAADLDQRSEGLRLLSELRSRVASRDAAFVIAAPPDRPEMAAIALDLGAGETLGPDLATPEMIEMTVLALREQIVRKRHADERRAEARQSIAWSLVDPLTSLYNRRFALPRLRQMIAETQARGGECALLALDVDRFKQINDQHGHAAGDAVLAEIAARIQSVAGPVGPVARFGGEEFLVLLPDTAAPQATRCAEAIRHAVMSTPIPLPRAADSRALFVTVSIGVATFGAHPGQTDAEHETDSLLERADQAMRAAKSGGRNRCMLAAA
ncbi:MAG: diguanylate cyclase [Paracoccus sp. (in: a-proteobacteria)]|uniref:diguanylate cyclase domain-containing protein n=1 Tax=Paracoccus sp. TaxID=267 RepID=UPI0026E0ED3A|nr:diguanylate cyclase [Paracoccus sp. (in: a-proteobacteria)]MDO5630475.1 diguanylate cyclase [Paracoccus sp. (in: a-proteobacteria)]